MRDQFVLTILLGLVAACEVTAQAPAQDVQQATASNGPGLLRGFAVTEVSGSIGGYGLNAPTSSGGVAPSSLLVSGAGTAEVGWFAPGDRSDFFVRYRATYSANDVYSSLDGFDETLSFGLRRNLTPRLTLAAGGLADSVLYADYLFSPLSSLSAAGSSGTLDQLSGSLATAPALGASPLGYAIFGARRIDLMTSATLTYAATPRSTWKIDGGFDRSLPGSDSSTRTLTEAGSVSSNGALATSDARTGISYGYALSERTTVGFNADYGDIGSSITQYQTGAVRFAAERRFGSDLFVQGGAGAGVVDEAEAGATARLYRTYVWNAGAGWKRPNETFLISARRDVADAYGLGAASTFNVQFAGIYHHFNSPWTFESSAGYERLSGITLGPVEGWLVETSATRMLTARMRLTAQGVYGNDYGFTLGPLTGVPRRGVKLSYIFLPGTGESTR